MAEKENQFRRFQLGEVFFPGDGHWEKADAWTATTFLKNNELQRTILVKAYDLEISRYVWCLDNKKPIGPLLATIVRLYGMFLYSLRASFTREEWPEIFSVSEKLKGIPIDSQ